MQDSQMNELQQKLEKAETEISYLKDVIVNMKKDIDAREEKWKRERESDQKQSSNADMYRQVIEDENKSLKRQLAEKTGETGLLPEDKEQLNKAMTLIGMLYVDNCNLREMITGSDA